MASAFFLFGDGDLSVEPTIDSAAGYMEPIDVRNGEYEAVFDETGRRYAVDVVGETTRLTRRTKLISTISSDGSTTPALPRACTLLQRI